MEGELGRQACPLFFLEPEPMARNAAAARSATAWSAVRVTPTADAACSGSHCRPGLVGETSVDDDRAEGEADLVLELVGGLDDLVDGHLLGQGDEGHLAAVGVGEELDDIGRLGPDRSRTGGVEQALGRGQKGHGVAGGGGVDQDEVGVASRSSCLILPRTRMSRMPGMAVATTSRAPDDTGRLEIRPMPWSARYSRRASSG